MPEDTLAQFSDIILIDIMYFVSFMFPQGSVMNALSAVRPSVSHMFTYNYLCPSVFVSFSDIPHMPFMFSRH